MNQTPLTFDAHDKLGLKEFSEKFERFLMVEHDFVDGSLVVSLNAPFGAGKTTFLSMWKSDLDKRRANDATRPQVVVINAWDNDYCGDPLLSLVDALIKAAGTDQPPHKQNANRLREAAKDVGWFVLGLANCFASHKTGIDPIEAAEFAEEKKKGREPKVPDFVTLYEERTKALRKLKETLRDVFGGEVPKILLFIDELDRCRPDYAISYLETIKHVFDVHGMIFVLAVDYQQLQCSAKALFGSDLKFADYFRKFAQRTIALPEPKNPALNELAYHYVKRYFEREGKRISLMSTDGFVVEKIAEIIGALKMPPRQIQETFRIIAHTVADDTGDKTRRGQLYRNIGTGAILMSALKVADERSYFRIGTGKMQHEEMGKLLIALLGKKKAEWWFSIYITGKRSGDEPDPIDYEILFKSLGFVKNDSSFDRQTKLVQFAQSWGDHWSDRWAQLYQAIETATSLR